MYKTAAIAEKFSSDHMRTPLPPHHKKLSHDNSSAFESLSQRCVWAGHVFNSTSARVTRGTHAMATRTTNGWNEVITEGLSTAFLFSQQLAK